MKHLIGWSYSNCRYYLMLTKQDSHDWTITVPSQRSAWHFHGMKISDTVVVLGPDEPYHYHGAYEWREEIRKYLHHRGVTWFTDSTDDILDNPDRWK